MMVPARPSPRTQRSGCERLNPLSYNNFDLYTSLSHRARRSEGPWAGVPGSFSTFPFFLQVGQGDPPTAFYSLLNRCFFAFIPGAYVGAQFSSGGFVGLEGLHIYGWDAIPPLNPRGPSYLLTPFGKRQIKRLFNIQHGGRRGRRANWKSLPTVWPLGHTTGKAC